MLYLILNIAIFMVVQVTAALERCPDPYLRYSANHTFYLKTNRKCNIINSSLKEKDIDFIMMRFNLYRSKIAVGKEVKLPTASNMLKMVWDKELADLAQKWVKQCKYEHDCNDCRRVRSFEVGQLIFAQYVTNSSYVPKPNWRRAVRKFYHMDRKVFSKKRLDFFTEHVSFLDPIHGELSQAFWASTWRIGCGFSVFKEENKYVKFYVCNYGPAGVDNPSPIYKPGIPCSACPENSCCDEACDSPVYYAGLCEITDNKVPFYKSEDSNFFHCNFRNQHHCPVCSPLRSHKWLMYSSLSGNFIGIILKGGQLSSFTFAKKMKPQKETFCFATHYRTGPNRDGLEHNNKAIVTLKNMEDHQVVIQVLPKISDSARHEFSQLFMSVHWKEETEVTFKFSVPPGKPEQFFEIKAVYAYDGKCKHLE